MPESVAAVRARTSSRSSRPDQWPPLIHPNFRASAPLLRGTAAALDDSVWRASDGTPSCKDEKSQLFVTLATAITTVPNLQQVPSEVRQTRVYAKLAYTGLSADLKCNKLSRGQF